MTHFTKITFFSPEMSVHAAAALLKITPGVLLKSTIESTFVQLKRGSKHWNPKFKKLRRQKFIKVDLPKYNEDKETLSEEQIRSRLKERGILPPRPWMERPVYISCSGGAFEPYVPPEGDGKMSAISKSGAKQTIELLEKKSKSVMAIRKIRSFDEDFNRHQFAEEAQEIYKKAHECLVNHDKLKLREYVTERIYPEMRLNTLNKTIIWKFLQSLEPPRVVHARCTDIITKDNIFGQLTVRFHSQQVLAVYDRFGRLMHGSEILAKDVLEYVVFEKHLSNQYGKWRIHEKIIPDWMPPHEPSLKTYPVQEIPASNEVTDTSELIIPDHGKPQETNIVH